MKFDFWKGSEQNEQVNKRERENGQNRKRWIGDRPSLPSPSSSLPGNPRPCVFWHHQEETRGARAGGSVATARVLSMMNYLLPRFPEEQWRSSSVWYNLPPLRRLLTLILSWGRPSGHRCRLLWFVNKSTEKNGAHAAWHNWQRMTWWQLVNRLLCISFLRSAASQSVRNMRYLFQLLPCCAKWAIYSTAACIIMEIWQCSRWAIGATEGAHISGRAAALKKKTIMAVESTCCCCCWFARRSWRCVISLTDSGLFIFMNFSVRFWWPRH